MWHGGVAVDQSAARDLWCDCRQLLRYGALEQGLNLMQDGFVSLTEVWDNLVWFGPVQL